MRILFLTNFYPPVDMGGWEQWCQEVADAFTGRGHDVWVLTSNYGLERVQAEEARVKRALYLESDIEHYRPVDFFLRLGGRDRRNRQLFRDTVAEVDPEVIFIWGMWQLDPRLARLAEELRPGRVAYYFCGYWPIKPDPHSRYWEAPESKIAAATLKRIGRPIAGRKIRARNSIRPSIDYAACVSKAVCAILTEGGVRFKHSEVIYGGIELARFQRPETAEGGPASGGPVRVLYAGSLSEAKGVDTLLEASALTAAEFGPERLQVELVGSGHPQFTTWAKAFVADNGLVDHVTFRTWVEHSQMAEVLHGFDVLAFPSRWDEPLARMMMEGMAAGLALVSTTTGGTGEVLEDGVNGLTFEAGNAQAMARQMRRLLEEPDLIGRLAAGGQKTATALFDFERMVQDLEAFVSALANGRREGLG